MPFFGSGGGGSSVDLASPSAIGSTTPNTGAFTTLSFAPSNNTTGFSNTGNSLTGSNAQSLVSLAQTWNTTGTPSAFLLNITNTASNSNSRLFDLQVGGSSIFNVRRDGRLQFSSGYIQANDSSILDLNGICFVRNNQGSIKFQNGEAGAANVAVGWAVSYGSGNFDLSFYRDAANVLGQRNGTSAQTFRLYRTFTDESNYERLVLTSSGTTRFSILAEKAGTGSDRQIEVSFYTSASDPTSTDIASGCFGVWKNSGTGTIKLWANDGGTMKSVSLA